MSISAAARPRDSVFPIVLGDARIYDAVNRLDYITYWEQKKQELDAKE